MAQYFVDSRDRGFRAARGEPRAAPMSTPALRDTALCEADLHVCRLGRSDSDHNARRVPRSHPGRRQPRADDGQASVSGTHLPGTRAAAHRAKHTHVHSPRDVHHRVLGSLQAHGNGPRALHHD